ncbi:MAG: hypothetical protein B7Y81_14920 [Caulobacter sp. 32-67-35]|nr:MAG: hypothetical protein B7Y81_14920 [Caulobacter sp. 32-67-35]
MDLNHGFTPPQQHKASIPKLAAREAELIPVVGFAVRDEDEARALLAGVHFEFAMFRPASFVVFPPTPYSVVVHLKDAATAQALLRELILRVEPDFVAPDYFAWHAAPSAEAWGNLETALKRFIAAHTADLKRPSCRGDVIRRLNSRMKRLPGVVPNEDFFGIVTTPFAHVDDWSDDHDFGIRLWHQNGGFDGRAWTDAPADQSNHAQVDQLDGNGDALAKWLLDNLPVVPRSADRGAPNY